MTWDRETEEFDDRPDQVVDSFTLVGTISYSIAKWLSVTTGLGKGFANTDNPDRSMRFTNGDDFIGSLNAS